MNESNEKLYDEAVQAATNLFLDQSVSPAETSRNLNSLIGEIEIMISSMKSPMLDEELDEEDY